MPTSLFPNPQVKVVWSSERGTDLTTLDSQKALNSIPGIAGSNRECSLTKRGVQKTCTVI